MWKNALKTILTKENYKKIKNERRAEVLEKLLVWYHHEFNRNKKVFNDAFPLLLKKIRLEEKRKEKLKKLFDVSDIFR